MECPLFSHPVLFSQTHRVKAHRGSGLRDGRVGSKKSTGKRSENAREEIAVNGRSRAPVAVGPPPLSLSVLVHYFDEFPDPTSARGMSARALVTLPASAAVSGI